MTEQNVVSIEEVRVLVAERQRYDDWLTALEARRAETPARVFERVFGDYSARRDEVLAKLHTHVDGLTSLSAQLDQRLSDLEGTLSSLEDERVEAMLRTAVGEFDDTRWEEVRAQVEERIQQLGQERDGLLTEVDEVRTLLASARVEAEVVAEPVAEPEPVEAISVSVEIEPDAPSASVPTPAAVSAVPTLAVNEFVTVSLVSDLASVATATPLGSDSVLPAAEAAAPTAPSALDDEDAEDVSALFDVPNGMPSRSLPSSEINLVTELPPRPSPDAIGAPPVEFDDALALFSENAAPADPGFVKSLDGIEVEIEPPVVQPQGKGPGQMDVNTALATPPSNAADPFDDLAFLRSVIDPGGAASPSAPPAPSHGGHQAPSGARPASGEQQKTLRCTECGTMNLPTEWYCERCGGELAAF
ncbi:MAG TPA: hypothetical protein VGE27_06345 [Gemmatimonas sp.]|uniref:hypothetical protein n=1 Tax=Gemmatimonas sp. TaxID=1962908 RepID=UPI002EDAE3EB